MSAYLTGVSSTLVTARPCKLYSVTLTPSSGASGDVTLYAARAAIAADILLTVRTANSQTTHVRFKGLEIPDGLYVSVGSNVTLVTIEWEPVGYSESEKL